jgi:hypothetical protein
MKEVKNHNTFVSIVVASIQVFQVYVQVLVQKVLTRNTTLLCENHLSVVAKPPPIFLTTRII